MIIQWYVTYNMALDDKRDAELLKKVMTLTTPEAVETFLKTLDIAEPGARDADQHEFVWYPLGDSFSNAANVNTTKVKISPIIERITNGFDACIELKEKERNEKPQPASPRDAVGKWFNIPAGDTAEYSTQIASATRTKFAENTVIVSFVDSGNEKTPTIVVRDFGIGIAADEFTKKILKLGKSGKIHSTHLHGTFGHGGSSTYRFCPYTIILSRPNPKAEKPDEIGWTVVKKFKPRYVWDEETQSEVLAKASFHAYLGRSNKSVPRARSDSIGMEFVSGTKIIHIAYEAESWQNLSRGGGYMIFRNYLFDPVLPFRLEDERESREENFDRNMFGARATLLKSKDVAYKQQATRLMTDGGKLLIRYWVMFDKTKPQRRPLKNYLERDNSRHTIVITQNGQRHGALDRALIAKRMKMPTLSEFLLVQVVIDELSVDMKDNLFTSGREEMLEEGTAIEDLRSKIIECIEEDEELKEWERNLLRQTLVTSNDESTKRVRDILDRLINVGIMPGFGGKTEKTTQTGPGRKTEKYNPNDPPTKLRVPSKQDPLEIVKDKSKRITLEIDGPDTLLTRRKNKVKLTISIPKEARISASFDKAELQNGRLPVILYAEENAPTFDPVRAVFKLEGEQISTPIQDERAVVVIQPPEFKPNDPPKELKILRSSPIRLRKGRKNVISIALDGPNDLFSRAERKAELVVESNNPQAKFIGFTEPANGRFHITLEVPEDASVGATGKLNCLVKLNDGTSLSDTREYSIVEPPEPKLPKVGGETTITLPNYEIIPITKIQWTNFDPVWDDTSVGKFELATDDTGRDLLRLFINIDNEHITREINRRLTEGQTTTTVTTLREKYNSYIAYHLYQQFEAERGEYTEPQQTQDSSEQENTARKPAFDEAQKSEELKRVAQTLVMSFMSLKDIPEY